MSALDNKFHVKIGGFGFLLAKQARVDRHIYTREEAPTFVNKFSSGEPNYRDSTFFPHWVQLNWQNGFNQEFFDDGGKYYRSYGLDTTDQQKLKLEKRFSSAGQTVAGKIVLSQGAFRSAANAPFKEGGAGDLNITSNTTKTVIDSAATGSSGAQVLSATNASFQAGQFILIHQTKGSNHGVMQENKILSYSSGVISLEKPLNATYSTGAQVVVMEEYANVTIDSGMTLSAPAYDGTKGGILTFYVSDTLTKTGNLSANAKGFRGGDAVSRTFDGYPRSGFSGESYNNAKNSTGGGSVQNSGSSPGDGAAVNGAGGYGIGIRSDDQGSGGGGASHGTAGANGSNGGRSPTINGGQAGATYGTADLSAGAADLGSGGGSGGVAGDSANSSGKGGTGGGFIYIIAKNISGSGSVTANAENGDPGAGGGTAVGGGGAGSGGSILIKTQSTAISGTITALGGSGGTGGFGGGAGGIGGNGRIHVSFLDSMSITSTPTANTKQDGTLTNSSDSSTFTHLVGLDDGKIYSWDGAETYTELFDTRQLTWFDSGADEFALIGDDGGTEKAEAQSFQLDDASDVKALRLHLKKNAGTPGDITVRIETNNSTLPSGTLVNDSAETTIPAFTETEADWITVEFPASFSLNASTTYWVVVKIAAGSNDNNYGWSRKSSSGYSNGNNASSTNGGTSYSAGTKDCYFQILSNPTKVNVQTISEISGTRKQYFGVGDPEGTTDGDARIYSYDGNDFALVHTFTGTGESSVLSMREFGTTTTKMFIGLGHKAKIYSTEDFTTFTLSKTITDPNYPGYVLCMTEYAGKLFVGGGFPEQLNQTNYQYNGFLYAYDEFSWNNVFPFDHTVVTSLEVFDTLMFIGTIKKRLYVYNTANIDKLFDFPWDVSIIDMTKWDDKLLLTITNTPGTSPTGNEGIYVFDRNGFHHAFTDEDSAHTWHSLFVFNNNLMAGNNDGEVYQTSANSYQDEGTLQTSYDEASLPSIEKIRRAVTLMCEALPADASISIEYKTDESENSWVSLGTLSTEGATEGTFYFGSGVYSKKISFRVTLATSSPGTTPVLKKIIHKYVLSPEFKYLWKMRLLCVDHVIWQDGTEPIAIIGSAISAGDTSITLKSNNDATPSAGFPDPDGEVMYASIEDPSTGDKDEFSYTGKTDTTLTGIPATGEYALGAHSVGDRCRITGKNMHKKILDLKQTRQLYTFTDIDGIEYTVLFHAYQADVWAINQDNYHGGLENEVPITLLEA